MASDQGFLFPSPKDGKGAGYVDYITLQREKVTNWEEYPFSIPCIRQLEKLTLHPAVTFLVGENGSGKSTLLEAIAMKLGFSAEGGTKNFRFSTKDTHSTLHEFLRTGRRPKRETDHFFLRAESFYTLMTAVEDYETTYQSWGGIAPHQRSHGEAFLTLMLNKMRGNGLYLFDEPEAALSPKRQMAALVRLHDLVRKNSQFIIATHSPILLAYPFATIYECNENGLKEVFYEETEVFRSTRDFVQNPARFVNSLLAGED